MPKKKKNFHFDSNYIYIAVIALSAIIGGAIILSDVKKTVDETDVTSEIANSPAGQIVAEFQELGETAHNVEDFKNIKDVLEAEKKSNGVHAEDDDTGEAIEYYETVFVRAKDGDTYVVRSEEGEESTIRLIGVDTPESVAPASYSKENTEEGKKVSDIVKDKLHEGDTVFLEFDASKEDKYGRVLAYVYLEDGTMMQDWLLENGYARTATYPPNVKYADHFTEVQHKAAENNVGLWNGFFEEEGE